MKTSDYRIPARTNLSIFLLCNILYFSLLLLTSHTRLPALSLVLPFLFAIVMIPIYSLMHEAVHHLLQPDQRLNAFLGRWLCTLFIVPYSFLQHCHARHHKKNRTDDEMWDLYYEHQNKWRRFGNLYGMMIGLGYFSLWLSVLLFAFAPRLLFTRAFSSHREIAGFLKGADSKDKVRNASLESRVIILFHTSLFLLFRLELTSWMALFVIHGFIWSSMNYVNHAFSPRDIINGAHNLTVPWWARWLHLNFSLHLAHHQNPSVPWINLPSFVNSGDGRISFLRNYIRLWKGPRLTSEPSPLQPVETPSPADVIRRRRND